MNYYSFNDIKFFNLEKKKILELDINFPLTLFDSK